MKTFLFPEIVRRGQPVVEFVVAEQGGWWLGVYHDFHGRGAPAEITDYHAVARSRISKAFYDAFVAESKRNHKRYKAKDSSFGPRPFLLFDTSN